MNFYTTITSLSQSEFTVKKSTVKNFANSEAAVGEAQYSEGSLYNILHLVAMNLFSLCKRNLFRNTAEKPIVLNYGVINDVKMLQYIYQ